MCILLYGKTHRDFLANPMYMHCSPAMKSCLVSRTRSYRIQRNQFTDHQQTFRDACGWCSRPSMPCTWSDDCQEKSYWKQPEVKSDSSVATVFLPWRHSSGLRKLIPKWNLIQQDLDEEVGETRSSEIFSRCF